MKILFLILPISMSLVGSSCLSQDATERKAERTERPQLEKPIPPFTLNDVYLGDSAFQLSSSDFRGKWLFLDFWYRGCVSCIRSFPKINAFQERFRDRVHFILVGVNSKMDFGDGIKVMFDNLRQKQGLSLTVAYDSLLSQQWDIHSFPHIIIADPNGIVKAITAGLDLTEKKLEALMNGESATIARKDVPQPDFAPDNISVLGEKLLHISTITRWNGERRVIPVILSYNQLANSRPPQTKDNRNQPSRIVASKLFLTEMFRLAFIGKSQWPRTDSLYKKYYPFPIIETHRKSLFEHNLKAGTGLYTYYLQTTAPVTPRRIMELMQHELQSTFEFVVRIEKRQVPVWKLVSKPGAGEKLRTKGNTPGYTKNNDGDGGVAGFEFSNFPISSLLNRITRYISDNEPPFFDCTGIEHNIDIKFDALLTDRQQIVKALQRHGLDLIKEDKEMDVIVIRDARKQN